MRTASFQIRCAANREFEDEALLRPERPARPVLLDLVIEPSVMAFVFLSLMLMPAVGLSFLIDGMADCIRWRMALSQFCRLVDLAHCEEARRASPR